MVLTILDYLCKRKSIGGMLLGTTRISKRKPVITMKLSLQ